MMFPAAQVERHSEREKINVAKLWSEAPQAAKMKNERSTR